MSLQFKTLFKSKSKKVKTTDDSVGTQPSKMVALEPRVMLDASAFPLAVEAFDESDPNFEIQPNENVICIPLCPKALLKDKEKLALELHDEIQPQEKHSNTEHEDNASANTEDYSELLSALDLTIKLPE